MVDQSKFLDQEALKRLAACTAHWLYYKKLSGFERLLSEASLISPVADFFLGNGWSVAAEQDYYERFQVGTKGTAYCDLVADKDLKRVIVETKFRENNQSRLFQDLCKLGRPPDCKNCQRLLLIVSGHPFGSLLTKLSGGGSLRLKRDQLSTSFLLDDQTLPLGDKRVLAYIEKMTKDLPNLVEVRCAAHEDAGMERVFVVTVEILDPQPVAAVGRTAKQ